MPSTWPAHLRANLCLEARRRPPLVRTPLPLVWVHQAATSPLGHPQHPVKALLELDLSDQRPLRFPLVQDPRPQGLDRDCRPEGSTLARNSLSLVPFPPPLTQIWTSAPARKSLTPFEFHRANLPQISGFSLLWGVAALGTFPPPGESLGVGGCGRAEA